MGRYLILPPWGELESQPSSLQRNNTLSNPSSTPFFWTLVESVCSHVIGFETETLPFYLESLQEIYLLTLCAVVKIFKHCILLHQVRIKYDLHSLKASFLTGKATNTRNCRSIETALTTSATDAQ